MELSAREEEEKERKKIQNKTEQIIATDRACVECYYLLSCYQNKYSSVPSIPASIRISIYFYKTLRPIEQVQISSRYCPLKREQKY